MHQNMPLSNKIKKRHAMLPYNIQGRVWSEKMIEGHKSDIIRRFTCCYNYIHYTLLNSLLPQILYIFEIMRNDNCFVSEIRSCTKKKNPPMI